MRPDNALLRAASEPRDTLTDWALCAALGAVLGLILSLFV